LGDRRACVTPAAVSHVLTPSHVAVRPAPPQERVSRLPSPPDTGARKRRSSAHGSSRTGSGIGLSILSVVMRVGSRFACSNRFSNPSQKGSGVRESVRVHEDTPSQPTLWLVYELNELILIINPYAGTAPVELGKPSQESETTEQYLRLMVADETGGCVVYAARLLQWH
jgi:hypothetical protein